MTKIAIIGTGAWGTALADLLANCQHEVKMYGINEKEINDINKGFNKAFFGNYKINKNIKAFTDLSIVVDNVDYIILAVPSVYIIDVLKKIVKTVKNKPFFINATKGLDSQTKNILSLTLKKIIKDKSSGFATLSGPSFAIDVLQKKPTIVNIVAQDINDAIKVSKIFDCWYFKAIAYNDEKGCELSAALKNLLAIATGIAMENHDSINTISAMLTHGIQEISKIICFFGGKSETILQFCSIGDIFLTCTSLKSRNFSFGKEIYKKGLYKALDQSKKTVEGYNVYKVVENIINEMDDDASLPIFRTICEVLSGKINAKKFVNVCIKKIGLTYN